MMRSLAKNTSGVALIEFAMTLPFLVLLYLGGFQISDAISAYRKVTVATRTVADLTSQYTSVSKEDLDSILNASQQVMAPYKVTNAKIIVSQIWINAGGKARVDWSHGKGVDGLAKNSKYTLPSEVIQKKTYLIVASIEFDYTPVVAPKMIGSIKMRDDIIMSPRASDSVEPKWDNGNGNGNGNDDDDD
jgi:Flp pilus assembly protein TadG